MQSPSSSLPVPNRTAASNVTNSKPPVLRPAQGASVPAPSPTRLPSNIMRLQPGHPLKLVDGDPLFEVDDPVFEVREAAAILGLSKELMDKWRERGQGPQFIQYYGRGGPVRYRFSALEAFKAAHAVHPSRQPRSRMGQQ